MNRALMGTALLASAFASFVRCLPYHTVTREKTLYPGVS